MAILLAGLKALAAIPQIGELIERVTRELSSHFAELRYQKERAATGAAADQTQKALTAEEKYAALEAWHRVGR